MEIVNVATLCIFTLFIGITTKNTKNNVKQHLKLVLLCAPPAFALSPLSNNQNLITYFDEQIKPTGSEVQTINTSLLALKHIDDTAVKSILYNKLSLALSKEIKVHLFLNFDITSFDIKSLDLSKVLGIFLDNAIEAASTTEEPILSVVFTKKERLSLEIGNNFSGAAPDLTQLSEKGYSEKGSGRGLGLAQAEQILNQYPNILHKVNIENNIFIQSLTF